MLSTKPAANLCLTMKKDLLKIVCFPLCGFWLKLDEAEILD